MKEICKNCGECKRKNLCVDLPRAKHWDGHTETDAETRLMSLKPEPHWIPCSEELPKVKQKVLVQYADGSMATKRCNDAGHLAWFYSNAVAWMPAPEPYKG